jgi:hypothetical protein
MADVTNSERHQIAAPELRVDAQVEQGYVAGLLSQFQLRSDRVDVTQSKRGFLAGQLPLP